MTIVEELIMFQNYPFTSPVFVLILRSGRSWYEV